MSAILDPRPQLRMRRADLSDLPPVRLPVGCVVRSWQMGDEQRWVALLQENGDLGPWDMTRAEKAFAAKKGAVWRESIHFICCDGRAAATACVQLHADEAELGWVAVAPDNQGRGLGKAVCLVILHFLRKQGYRRCFLRSDDRRLPAIKIYLDLGFRPDLAYHESFPARWRAVEEALAAYAALKENR